MNSLKFISSGAYGSVFDTGKFALKVTTDAGEVENAKIIMSKPHPNVVKIYQVHEDPSPGKFRRWIILMEKVQTPENYQNKEILEFWWKLNYDEIIKQTTRAYYAGFWIDDVMNRLGDYKIPEFWKGLKEELMSSQTPYFIRQNFGKWIVQAKKLGKYISKNKIIASDFHDENWGWNKNGNLKVFDISSCACSSPEEELDINSELGKKNLKFAQEFWDNNSHIYTKKRNHGKSN